MRTWLKIFLVVIGSFLSLLSTTLLMSYVQGVVLQQKREEFLFTKQESTWQRIRARVMIDLQFSLANTIQRCCKVHTYPIHYSYGTDTHRSVMDLDPVYSYVVTMTAKDLHPHFLQGPVFSRSVLASMVSMPTSGLGMTQDRHLVWFATYPLSCDPQSSSCDRRYAVAYKSVHSSLLELSQELDTRSFIVNNYGQFVESLSPVPIDVLPFDGAISRTSRLFYQDNRVFLLLTHPLVVNTDNGRLARLGILTDVTEEYTVHHRIGVIFDVVLIFSTLLILCVTLRSLYRILLWIDQVLGPLYQLSCGRVPKAPSEDMLVLDDDWGLFARITWRLRQERLNYDMLVDERDRLFRKRSKLLHQQLEILAKTLDEDARQEIVAALHCDADSMPPLTVTTNNRADRIGVVFEQLVTMVVAQQNRLKTLLRELQIALKDEKTLRALQQELEVARKIQQSILPNDTLTTAATHLYACMIPAREIGGDFYDYVQLDPDHLLFVIADVSGKGIPAAFFMVITKIVTRGLAVKGVDRLTTLVNSLNDILGADNPYTMFVTIFIGVLNTHSGHLICVNAGHPEPFLMTTNDQQEPVVVTVHGIRNLAVAVMDHVMYQQFEIHLKPNDMLFLYTDGFSEAMDAAGHIFEEKRLQEILQNHTPARCPQEVAQAAIRAVDIFSADVPQSDDMTCLVVHYNPVSRE